MTLFSTIMLENVSLLVAILITFLFILLGIVFDIVGVAVTSGDAVAFHSMSSRKVKGGKIGVKLMKNTSKVSSVCCDVIGDVCGIISGTSGVVIVSLIIKLTDVNELIISLLVTGLISALTIGGKALGKGFAVNKSKEIVTGVSKMLSFFQKK
jgi:CBS domain containing-hemolysin-like protein